MKPITTERVLSIFSELNRIPRPSHHEERVADWLCRFADRLHLEYERDARNCVVIRKPATPGYESAAPVVLLNHMDMVCVGMRDPLNDTVEAFVENGWMKARGTSLGADNGIGLSMALAVLESEDIPHPALEVITTTNEEDGMTGAAALSPGFIRGRRVINLDSEDYDTITTGAAGACLQLHRLPMRPVPSPGGKHRWYRIRFEGGRGGHSGVDINRGRCSAVIPAWAVLAAIWNEYDIFLSDISVGEANASIASSADITVCVPSGEASEFVKAQQDGINAWLREEYGEGDPDMHCTVTKCERRDTVIPTGTALALLRCLEQIPQGVIRMSESMEDTVETSNNVGIIRTLEDHILVSTHTRSFVDADMDSVSRDIARVFAGEGATSETVMSAPAWQEDPASPFIRTVSDTFHDVLGWRPRTVAMHFVLEAGFFVRHYPGIQIASIGPRIVEPHSAGERVELKTVHDIWQVLIELLKRLR